MSNKYLNELRGVEKKYLSMLHLTANENILSDLAERFYHSPLEVRYDMGGGIDGVVTHGNFAAKGMPEIRRLVDEATYKANQMLHANFTTLNCLSGVHAMMSSMLSMTKPGDTVMTVLSRHGGHFCTKGILEMTGRKQIYAEYNFDKQSFDVEKSAKIFKDVGAKMLYLDVSVYLKPHPIREFRKALGPDAVIIYDASHTLGLIMAGMFQSPLEEGADIISANTHKTLPGPHKGLIAFKDKEAGEKANALIAANLYSTVHTNSLLALAISIIEAHRFGKEYAVQVIKNSNALGAALEKQGFVVRRTEGNVYSKNHQVHMFTTLGNREIVRKFLDNNISINTSRALGDSLFIRFGTQEITKRGMKEKNMEEIARLIKDVINGQDVQKRISVFNKRFPNSYYGFPVR